MCNSLVRFKSLKTTSLYLSFSTESGTNHFNKIQPRHFLVLKFTLLIHLKFQIFFLDPLLWNLMVIGEASESHIDCCLDILKISVNLKMFD